MQSLHHRLGFSAEFCGQNRCRLLTHNQFTHCFDYDHCHQGWGACVSRRGTMDLKGLEENVDSRMKNEKLFDCSSFLIQSSHFLLLPFDNDWNKNLVRGNEIVWNVVCVISLASCPVTSGRCDERVNCALLCCVQLKTKHALIKQSANCLFQPQTKRTKQQSKRTEQASELV